ncbi:polymorphic toxin type 25 domain-containing protein [Pectobacteriaceae bacterium C111]|nr:polymorphic toxin type 25 domain-containing protein [Pectobacteriaceae bacterium C111]
MLLQPSTQSYGAAATSLDNYLAQNGASVEERIKAQSNLANGVGPSIGDEYKITPTAKAEGAAGIGLGVFAEGVVDKDKFALNGGFSPTFGLRGGATVGFDFGPYLPGVISTNKDYSIDVGLGVGSLGITSGKDGVGISIGVGPSIDWSGFSKEIKGVDVDGNGNGNGNGNGKVGKEIYKYEFNKDGK